MLLSDKKDVKKAAIYFFYDKDGIVDDYNIYLLNDLKKNVDQILVVCNGKLTIEGRKKFEHIGCTVFVRDNVGFDVWAYKEAMEWFGWDKIVKLDELILLNFTIFGPFRPFSEMFHRMDATDVDFWGITLHHGASFDPWRRIKCGYLPMHLQSHFIAVRNSMLKSVEFKLYWDNMCPIECYEDAVCCHEAVFTKTFAEKGFAWKAYVDTEKLGDKIYYPLMMMPVELLRDYNCPIIKRKSFFLDTESYLNESGNEAGTDLSDYIRNNTDYDFNLILQNLIRTENVYDLKNSLGLNYVLPSTSSLFSESMMQEHKVALIMHIYDLDLADYCLRYAASMPAYTDVYLTTGSEENKENLEIIFKDLECRHLEVRVVENRGRDVSALLIGCRDIVSKYDYICFAHDKNPKNVIPITVGKSFSYQCYECVLRNKTYVSNIINTFDSHPMLGMMMPPPPNYGAYYLTIGHEWTENIDVCDKLKEKLKLNVNVNKDKPPIAPLGTIFWFRSVALQKLFDYKWEYADFPEEPIKSDGTLLHGIERIYPFVVQDSGYYPAWVMPENFAGVYINNIYYYLRTLNVRLFGNEFCTHNMLVERLDTANKEKNKSSRLVIIMKFLLPPFLYKGFRFLWRKAKSNTDAS